MTNQVLFSFNRTDGLNVPIYPPKTFKDLGINIFNDDPPAVVRSRIRLLGHAEHRRYEPLPAR